MLLVKQSNSLLSAQIIVEREVLIFYNNCALPDTSMKLSAFVLQTFLVIKSMLANEIFSIFKMATMIFKMAVKLIIIQQIKVNLRPKLVFFFWIKMSSDTFLMYHTERRLHFSLSYSSVEKQTGSKMADKTMKFGILMYV